MFEDDEIEVIDDVEVFEDIEEEVVELVENGS